jgi:hypothetical protein
MAVWGKLSDSAARRLCVIELMVERTMIATVMGKLLNSAARGQSQVSFQILLLDGRVGQR